MKYQCPYCNKDCDNWSEVINHTKTCNKNTFVYAIHQEIGPVHVDIFNSNTGDKLVELYGESFTRYAKEKFRKKGLLTQVFRKSYSKEIIIEYIIKYYETYNKVPIGLDFDNLKDYPSRNTVAKYFGSWNNAIEAAKLPINISFGGKKASQVSSEDIIKNIMYLYSKFSRAPTSTEYKQLYDINMLIKVFGKWSIALQSANLEKFDTRAYSKEHVVSTLLRAYKEDGSLRLVDYLDKDYSVSKDPINRLFGSWSNMLLELNIPNNTPSSLYGVPTIALDSHTYLSRLEATFVNKFLYEKYSYIIEPNYPDSTWRYDWYIPSLDLYIELFGGLRPERLAEKIQLNKLLNRKLLIVTKKDIDSNSELEEILKNVSE
jgi:hypothetical protein